MSDDTKQSRIFPGDDDEELLKKNRINAISPVGKKFPGIKKPIIIVSVIGVTAIIAVLILIKFFYNTPKPFTLEKKPENIPFDNVRKSSAGKSDNIHIKRGMESYTKGYLNDAVSEFNEVVESDSQESDKAIALTYLGIISDDRGNHDKAIDFYNRALKYEKNSIEIYKNLSLSHRYKKDYDRSVEYAEKSLSIDPKDVNSMLLLGNIYYEMGKYKEAIRIYGKALEINPDNPSIFFNMGSALLKTGDEFSAIEYFKKAGTSDRIGEIAHRAYSRLGVLYTERHDYLIAEKFLELALAIRPQDAVNNYNLGIAYLKMKKTDKALEMFENAEKLGEKDSQVQENVGEAYLSMNQYEKSLGIYNRLLATSKRNIKILSRIGEIYYKKGDLDKAYESYRKITEVEPATENARIAYLNMGNIMDDAQMFEDAIRAYQKALAISPKDSAALHNIGIAYRHAGKPELAIQSWKESSSLDDKSPNATIAIGDYYYEKGFYDLAEKEYQNILARFPNQQDVHFKIATIYYKRNSLEYALDAYRRVLGINDNNDLARKSYVNMAIISIKLKTDEETMKEAVNMLNRALLIKPGDPDALLTMGLILSAKEMHDQAVDAFYQALKNSNDSKLIAEIYNNIGKTYYKKKLYKKAMQAFTRGIDEDPSNEQMRMNRKSAMQAYESELGKERQ